MDCYSTKDSSLSLSDISFSPASLSLLLIPPGPIRGPAPRKEPDCLSHGKLIWLQVNDLYVSEPDKIPSELSP